LTQLDSSRYTSEQCITCPDRVSWLYSLRHGEALKILLHIHQETALSATGNQDPAVHLARQRASRRENVGFRTQGFAPPLREFVFVWLHQKGTRSEGSSQGCAITVQQRLHAEAMRQSGEHGVNVHRQTTRKTTGEH